MNLCKYNVHLLLSSEFMSVESLSGEMPSGGPNFIILVTGAISMERRQGKRNMHQGPSMCELLCSCLFSQLLLRKSVLRQVDKKSGASKQEIWVWSLKKEKRTNFFFPSTFLSLSHIKQFFSLSPELKFMQQNNSS